MVTAWVFTAFVIMLALQRIFELRLSARNEAIIRSRGGVEHVPWQVQAMKVLHAGWFVAMLLEVHILRRPFIPFLSMAALVILLVGQSLRYTAIRSLQWRWTVKVMTLPGLPLVRQGIYRHLRHPNYLGVALEILAVPLLHSAYVTSIFFSLANLLLLNARIRAEETALLDAVSKASVINENM